MPAASRRSSPGPPALETAGWAAGETRVCSGEAAAFGAPEGGGAVGCLVFCGGAEGAAKGGLAWGAKAGSTHTRGGTALLRLAVWDSAGGGVTVPCLAGSVPPCGGVTAFGLGNSFRAGETTTPAAG